jgi:hypothetical protein
MTLFDGRAELTTTAKWQTLLTQYVGHYVAAVVGSMLLGLVPEGLLSNAYVNTPLSTFPPFILASAALLGYFVNRRFGHRTALFIWGVALGWFALGFWELCRNWSPAWDYHRTRWAYAAANLFGPTPRCSGTECMYELFFTFPLATSCVYSLFALLGLRSFRAKTHTVGQ